MSKGYHFIGIGGIGMSGLAHILLEKGISVSGSDLSFSPTIERLIQEGASVIRGHSADVINPDMRVVYGSDIPKNNPEYHTALAEGCDILHRSDLLAELTHNQSSLAVAGVHGKTTTSALLSTVFLDAGFDPSFAIGGILSEQLINARAGKGKYFPFEADESDGSFLKYHPFGAIVTNIDDDHLVNYQGSRQRLIEAFQIFMSQTQTKEHLFWCAEDPYLNELNHPGQRYGFKSGCDWRAYNIRQRGFSTYFDIEGDGHVYKDVELSLIGQHNVLNALAVFGLATSLHVEENSIRNTFKCFKGVLRRCEKKGEVNNVLVLDDYAHHPTEIVTTLQGIRQSIGERRLIAIFQPHRYTRIRDCLGSYGPIFETADEVFITDVYAAGESPIDNFSHVQIMEEVRSVSATSIQYVPRTALNHKLTHFVRPHDVVVMLGAGDITKLGVELIASLEKHSPQRLKLGLIFGGSFTEHEVSIRSADHFRNSLRKDYYDVTNIGITKSGTWIVGEDAKNRLQAILDGREKDSLSGLSSEAIDAIAKCDVLVPVLHGPLGEDGTIQGLFEMFGKAYVGCDHRSSAICMDKVLSKKLILHEGIKTLPFIDFSLHQWQVEKASFLHRIKKELTFPVFVKPSHGGSSVGVRKVVCEDQLEEAIDYAFRFDSHILVEQGIVGREIEFAVLGNDEITVFPPGEILTNGEVYDYQAKYGANGIKAIPDNDLSDLLIEQGKEFAARVYRTLMCSGLSRIDFFLDRNEVFWFNEINPMPGFTAISLYPEICAKNGLSASDLMDRLIVLALQKKRQQERINRTFYSNYNMCVAEVNQKVTINEMVSV